MSTTVNYTLEKGTLAMSIAPMRLLCAMLKAVSARSIGEMPGRAAAQNTSPAGPGGCSEQIARGRRQERLLARWRWHIREQLRLMTQPNASKRLGRLLVASDGYWICFEIPESERVDTSEYLDYNNP